MNSVATRRNHPLVSRAGTAAALLCLGLASQAALAGIDTGGSAAFPNNPELFLTLIDGTAKLSYTLDLNIRAADFYINAQQDTGSYLFFSLDPNTDVALKTFVSSAGAGMANTRWSVLGVNLALSQTDQRALYSTLTNNGDVATQTANYDKLFNTTKNGPFKTNTSINLYLSNLNAGVPEQGTIQLSTLNTASSFGSALASSANPGTYPSKTMGWYSSDLTSDGDCIFGGNICVGNPVGTSSWFYKTSVSAGSALAKVAVDEFDNLTNDGYWGFIKDPNSGKYILSYTLQGSNPKSLVSTDAGRARLSITDYSASAGPARMLSFTDAASVSAVPEPQTWGLMALGGLLVAARVRRERRRA